MQVRIGYQADILGTVEDSPDGLVIHSTDPSRQQQIKDLLTDLRQHYFRFTDAQFLQILPRALSGAYYWAHDTIYDDPDKEQS